MDNRDQTGSESGAKAPIDTLASSLIDGLSEEEKKAFERLCTVSLKKPNAVRKHQAEKLFTRLMQQGYLPMQVISAYERYGTEYKKTNSTPRYAMQLDDWMRKETGFRFYADFAKYLQAERESLAEVSINKGNLMNDRNVADCRNNKLDSLIHAAEVKGIGNAFDSALGTGAVFAAKISEAGTDAPASYGLLSSVRGMRLSDFLEQSTDCSSGVDTLLLTTDQGKAVSVVEECHGAIRADGTEKVTEIEFRQLKPFEAYKTAQLLQSDGLDSAELDSLAAKIFMDMDGLQMCTDLAEQMAWECSTERSELAEVLWNGDPEQGIAALADVAVDDDDCIKQEWMGYKPGTPRFAVWKDFETNFSKDGVSLCELSGFDDYKVEYKDPGPTLSESEFDKLFGSDVLDENVQKDVSDVNRDDPGSEDER